MGVTPNAVVSAKSKPAFRFLCFSSALNLSALKGIKKKYTLTHRMRVLKPQPCNSNFNSTMKMIYDKI